MNENNINYLLKQVMYTGFGESLESKIRENVAQNQPSFEIKYKPDFGNGQTEATLHFRRSDQGNYFFNKYDLQVGKDGAEPLTQSFKVSSAKAVVLLDKDNNVILDQDGKPEKEWITNTFTSKEAYNLLEGRSVLKDFVTKEGVKVTLWSKADLGNKDQYGNYLTKTFPGVDKDERAAFNLEAVLSKFPIKELGSEDTKKQLIESLQKGNHQNVTMVMPGNLEFKRSIEANPQYKTINIYEGARRVKHQTVKQSQGAEQDQAQKNTTKANTKAGSDDSPTQKVEKKGKEKKPKASLSK
jgi:hypothetical protein